MSQGRSPSDAAVLDLLPVVRRVVASRVRDPHRVDDLVQEVIARVMAARTRVDGDLVPYAVTIAKNLVAETARRGDRDRRHAHRLLEVDLDESPGDGLLREEDRSHVGAALAQLDPDERAVLLAHEVDGKATTSLAASRGATPGAIAAQLARTRAKMRVEYLLERDHIEPPTERCRPVLRALSAGDRRRQGELDVRGHQLECDACAVLGRELEEGRDRTDHGTQARVPVTRDADVVTARGRGRELAAGAGFGPTEQTVIATAISEVARNIVKFAQRGEIQVTIVTDAGRCGVRVVARDMGPGISDVAAAMEDGYSTYQGLGLGLPGSRRLMDEFEVESELGRGTTVTMTKWR